MYVASYAALIFSPVFTERAVFSAYIFLFLTFLEAIKILDLFKYRITIFILYILIIFLCFRFSFSYKTANQSYLVNETQHQIRLNEIEEQKNRGEKDIFLTPIHLVVDAHYWGINEIGFNKNMTSNRSMAAYFQVENVRLKSDYLFQIDIQNITKGMSVSLNIETMEGQHTSDELRMLDIESKKTLANYKRYYYAFTDEVTEMEVPVFTKDISKIKIEFDSKWEKIRIYDLSILKEREILKKYRHSDIFDKIVEYNEVQLQENANIDYLEVNIKGEHPYLVINFDNN